MTEQMQKTVGRIEEIDAETLLGRSPVRLDVATAAGYLTNKTVLVTGAGGSIGGELCRQLATCAPKQLILLDICENGMYDVEQELFRRFPTLKTETVVADIREEGRIRAIFKRYRPQSVFHAAAHKHVPMMEKNPCECVKNNVFGALNVMNAAKDHGTENFVFISSDKAVNPTSVMGATKRIGEMLVRAMSQEETKTKFAAVRFGNVLCSNGSVVPLFLRQIAEGGPVTVTHKDITRYFMTLTEAVSLVLQASAYAEGGEIFVLDMGEQIRIYDLAEKLIRLHGLKPHKDIGIVCTGLRKGEKLREERLNKEDGLQKTHNGLISVARPLPVDREKLFECLRDLREAAYAEASDIKLRVKELVPSYTVDTTDTAGEN